MHHEVNNQYNIVTKDVYFIRIQGCYLIKYLSTLIDLFYRTDNFGRSRIQVAHTCKSIFILQHIY
jgi:hypothetical protein